MKKSLYLIFISIFSAISTYSVAQTSTYQNAHITFLDNKVKTGEVNIEKLYLNIILFKEKGKEHFIRYSPAEINSISTSEHENLVLSHKYKFEMFFAFKLVEGNIDLYQAVFRDNKVYFFLDEEMGGLRRISTSYLADYLKVYFKEDSDFFENAKNNHKGIIDIIFKYNLHLNPSSEVIILNDWPKPKKIYASILLEAGKRKLEQSSAFNDGKYEDYPSMAVGLELKFRISNLLKVLVQPRLQFGTITPIDSISFFHYFYGVQFNHNLNTDISNNTLYLPLGLELEKMLKNKFLCYIRFMAGTNTQLRYEENNTIKKLASSASNRFSDLQKGPTVELGSRELDKFNHYYSIDFGCQIFLKSKITFRPYIKYSNVSISGFDTYKINHWSIEEKIVDAPFEYEGWQTSLGIAIGF